jgi:hypothetical protein
MSSSLSAPLQIEYRDFYGRLHPEETDSFAENGVFGKFGCPGVQNDPTTPEIQAKLQPASRSLKLNRSVETL